MYVEELYCVIFCGHFILGGGGGGGGGFSLKNWGRSTQNLFKGKGKGSQGFNFLAFIKSIPKKNFFSFIFTE